jgi:glycogen(starch) synthase
MKHLLISREYPPSPYRSGGIGTYADHISTLLARHGETVHAIGQLSPAASRRRETRFDNHLIVHRVGVDEPAPHANGADAEILRLLRASQLPAQAFMWQAALLADSLVDTEAIDVIEGQEYEAPLYFFLLRRALGLSRARSVPVIVHLHSPSEFIFKHNDWDLDRPDYIPLTRLEEYTIRAADALLCPSRFLACLAEGHYGLERGAVEVIPYPLGEMPVLRRDADTWASGSICYIGRLEPRKGVAEWLDAAVAVALHGPTARFVFIGGDTSRSGTGDRSMRSILRSRIPAALQSRFTFIDAVPRQELLRYLVQARIVVVPSRWENFPNTCIEAMSSGLPVLASPNGGMAEMIEHERTGWIADGADARSLELTLRLALSTPPEVLGRMGQAAAASIRAICDNEQTIRRQLDFRRHVVTRGCDRSPRIIPPSTGTAEELLARFPKLRHSSPSDLELLLKAALGRADPDAPEMNARPESDRVMSPLDILRATPWQRREIARRVLADPAHVAHWVVWHGRRTIEHLRQRVLGRHERDA